VDEVMRHQRRGFGGPDVAAGFCPPRPPKTPEKKKKAASESAVCFGYARSYSALSIKEKAFSTYLTKDGAINTPQ